jgi:hypothetical protein
MIIRQEVERHCGNLLEQFVEGRRVGSSGNVVAMAGPDRSLLVRGSGN